MSSLFDRKQIPQIKFLRKKKARALTTDNWKLSPVWLKGLEQEFMNSFFSFSILIVLHQSYKQVMKSSSVQNYWFFHNYFCDFSFSRCERRFKQLGALLNYLPCFPNLDIFFSHRVVQSLCTQSHRPSLRTRSRRETKNKRDKLNSASEFALLWSLSAG